MAHVADELEHDLAERAADGSMHVPDIVGDRRALRVVPWGGEGPDPLGEEVGA